MLTVWARVVEVSKVGSGWIDKASWLIRCGGQRGGINQEQIPSL